MPDQDTLSPEDSAALVHAQQQLYSAGDPRATKLYNYIVQAGYATKGDNGELHPQGETKSFYDQNIKGTLSGTAGWQQAIDKAGQTEPINTSSVGGAAKSVANNLGAGAVRVFSPLVHPVNAAQGMGKIATAGLSMNPQAMGEAFQPAVEQAVKNPSGEAVAAIPQAAMALAGAGEAQPATEAAANAAGRVIRGAGKVASEEEGAMNAAGAPGGLEEALKVKIGGPPEQMLTSAIKPGKNNLRWTQDVKTASPYMKSAEADLGRPIAGIDDALEATAAAKQKIWQQVKAFMGPAAEQGARIDGNQIADAIMETVGPRMKQTSPELVAQLTERANAYRRPMSVNEAENFLSGKDGVNNELTTYYAKNKVSQRVAEGDPQMAATVAEGNALRDALYSKIDQMSGPGVSQMKQAYGALTNVEKELNGRQIVYARQAPVNLPEQLSYLKAAGKIATGNVLGGVKDIAVQRFLSDLNDTNSQIGRAFRNTKQAAPFPQPSVRMPIGNPARMLPGQTAAKTPLMAPDPGMTVGEMREAAIREFRRRQQLALPAQAEPFRLPPPQ